MPRNLTCDDLALIVKGTQLRVAVLIGLHDVGSGIQFVTYGRSAEDKAESHNLKEWIKEDVFDGEVPSATTHESFILDAAKAKQQRDGLLAACELLLADADAPQGDRAACERLYEAWRSIRIAVANAKGIA